MKKTLFLLVVFLMLLSLCACGNKPKSDTTNSIQETSTGIEETSNSTTESTQATDDEETTVPTQESATTPSEENDTKPTEKPIEPNNPNETTNPVHTHSYAAATCTQAKKCSCGATEGSALGHKWMNATCTTPKTCSVCKATEGNAAGHDWSDATCTAPKTCSVCKATEGNAAGHSWEDATCTTPKTCSACKVTEGNAVAHVVENTACKWCKQVLPISISKLKNRTYVLTCLTQVESEYGVVDALAQYDISFEWEYFGGPSFSLSGDCGITEGREQEWLESHRVIYKGKDYYSWGGGYSISFSKQISGEHIVLSMEDGSTIELELLSNDTLRVVSASIVDSDWKEKVKVGTIFE